jgi:micrococcal nuclease
MKRSFIVIVILAIMGIAGNAQSITAKEAGKYAGKSVTVCDKIYGGIFMGKSGSQPTFLNVGGAYPNEVMTIVIWGADRKKFKFKPEEFYKNRQVCITGEIKIFNGKAEIVVDDPKQIVVSDK